MMMSLLKNILNKKTEYSINGILVHMKVILVFFFFFFFVKPYKFFHCQILQHMLLKPALLTICKCFTRPHLDYGDIIYDHAYILPFYQKLESVQYNVVVALTRVIRGKRYLRKTLVFM